LQTENNKKYIDVIVTIRDEEEFLPIFSKEILNLKIPEKYQLRLLFIEDSSTDNTVTLLSELCRENKWIKGFSLKNGLGQIPAINWGLEKSDADYVVMMDIDGAHPINNIPKMIDAIENGADVAQGSRQILANRSFFRYFFSRIYNTLMYILTCFDSRKQNVYFRMISKDVKELIFKNY
jgi:glycosyltransferase involved in cell wall biosynthesis